MKLIKYIVEGFGPRTAGPYPDEEAEEQAADIGGYEGVSDVRIVPAPAVLAVRPTVKPE